MKELAREIQFTEWKKNTMAKPSSKVEFYHDPSVKTFWRDVKCTKMAEVSEVCVDFVWQVFIGFNRFLRRA